MPLRLRLRGMSLLLLWSLLVAGCGGGAPGTPGPGRSSDRSADTVAATLGDPRTVDPCTLTDPAKLEGFGQVTRAATVSLDYCLLHVRTNDGSLVQLAVGELANADQSKVTGRDPVLQRGPLRVVHDAPLPGHCTRQILFADQVTMQVRADQLSGGTGPRICGIAEEGADNAIAAIEQHRVGHRTVPPNSLALIDPCTVLDSALVQQVPGLEKAQPRSSPGGHRCQWGERDAASPRVRLMHSAGDPPKVLHGAAVEEQIAGRRTVISVVGGDPQVPLCSAETAHVPFGAPGSGQTEVAMLVVAIPGQTGIEACEFARGLAERAWPQLPPA